MPTRKGFSAPAPLFLHSQTKEQVSQGDFQAPVCDKNVFICFQYECILI